MFGIRKLLRQILQRLQALEDISATHARENAQSADQLALRLSELSSAANRHDMAIEDMLDSWEDLQEKQEEETRELASALSASVEAERKDAHEREKALLALIICAHDQMFALRKAAQAAGTENWARQLALAEQKLNETRLPAGFQVMDQTGIPVNFAVHEVIDVVGTQESAQDHLVAEVYMCGYLYRGRVLKKAQVSVYRVTNTRLDVNREGEST